MLDLYNGPNTLHFLHESTFLPFLPCATKHYAGAYRDSQNDYYEWPPTMQLNKQIKCQGMTMIKRGASSIVHDFETMVLFEALIYLTPNRHLHLH